jgi:hypothetical protein
VIIKFGPIDLAHWLKLHAWAEPREVKPGEKGNFVLEIEIPEHGHIQSHATSDPFLVPAELVLDDLDGIKFGLVEYPPHSEEKVFDWVWMKRVLSVYSGTIKLIVPFTIAADAASGVKKVGARLKYQGCTASDCLPPNTQDVATEITILPS